MNNHQPYGSSPPQGYPIYPGYLPPYPTPPEKKQSTLMATISFACGVYAITLPVPVLDIILAVAGIILAAIAMRNTARRLAIAGLVVSIIGVFIAIGYTAFALRWIDITPFIMSRL